MKKNYFLLLIVCFITNYLSASATIIGTVTDITTGLPISLAVVVAIEDNEVEYSGITGPAGTYVLSGVRPDNYILVVFALGYQNARVGVHARDNQITFSDFQLVPRGGTISGTVTDANTSLPIANATVSIFNGSTFITSTTTNASGQYSVPNLAPGNYIVLVSATNFQNQAQSANVQAGMATTVNFALVSPPGSISGTVIDAFTTNPISGAFVQVFNGSTVIGFATTDINGTYTIADLAPGNYTVIASADLYQTQAVGATVVANATTIVNFALNPNPGSVSGQVTNAQTGAPIAGATIVVIQNATMITSILTDVSGNYSINNLAPGEYTLVCSATNFGTSIAGVTITSNATSIANFALQSDPGSISGTVTNSLTSNPIPGATINVFDNVILIASTLTDAAGNYQIPNLAPGSYTVIATDANFQTAAQQANVISNQTTIVNFSLASNPGAIAGTVIDSMTTNPISGATVLVFEGNTLIGTGLTDVNGHYQIPDLAPGNYFVVVRASGYQSAFSTATVTSNSTTTENFSLNLLPGSISGMVQQSCTGDPVSGVIIIVTDGQVIVGFTVSDANGQYAISNLAPGSYTIVATQNDYFTSSTTAQVISQANTTVNFILTPAVPFPPEPPASISGFITRNKYLTQTDFIHTIVWTASPSKCITNYLIFRNNKQIASVSSDVFEFTDYRYAKKSATYMVKAVNTFDGISSPVTIVFS